jgi:hypothetical protein
VDLADHLLYGHGLIGWPWAGPAMVCSGHGLVPDLGQWAVYELGWGCQGVHCSGRGLGWSWAGLCMGLADHVLG